MDFFEAQHLSRKRTTRLVIFFGLAVLGVVIAVNLVVLGAFVTYDIATGQDDYSWWSFQRVVWTTGIVLGGIGLGTMVRFNELSGGGSCVAKSLGGRRIDTTTTNQGEKTLMNVVEEMSIAAGMPVPEVYVLDREHGINAFAAGFTPDDAAVAFTEGCLEHLERDELQGVAAHEIAHIAHGDSRCNLIMAALLNGLLSLTLLSHALRGNDSDDGEGFGSLVHGGGLRGAGAAGLLFLIVLGAAVAITAIGALGHFLGRLIQAATSREREYLADAAAVQFTRHLEGLRRALSKVGGQRRGGRIRHPGAENYAHLFFSSSQLSRRSGMMSTHPDLSKRIRAIDSSWDGKFTEVEIQMPASSRKAFSSHHRTVSPAEGQAVSQRMTMLSRLQGPPTAFQWGMLAPLLQGMPDGIGEQLQEPGNAQGMVLAILASAGSKPSPSLQAVFGPSIPGHLKPAFDRYRALLANVDDQRKLILLEVSLPALGELTTGVYNQFLNTVDQITGALDHSCIFAFLAARLVRLRLEPKVNGHAVQSGSIKYSKLTPELAPAVGRVLSRVARVATGSEDDAVHTFKQAIKSQYLLAHSVELLPSDQQSIPELEKALDTITLSSFAIRRQIVQAARAMVQRSKTITVSEYAIVRVLSATLGCPLPPLWQN